MRKQPNRNYRSNDVVMTPDALAADIVSALQPSGYVLEPCAGSGAFVRALQARQSVDEVMTCEIDHGKDFLDWTIPVDWVITNPPWSQFRPFLAQSLKVACNVAMLVTVNHWWTKHRVAAVHNAGFRYKHLWLCDWPGSFPSSGFQLGVMHIELGWSGPLEVSWIPGHGPAAGRVIDPALCGKETEYRGMSR